MPYVLLQTVKDLGLIHGTNDVLKFFNDVDIAKKLEYDSISEKEWKNGAKFKFIQKVKRQQLKATNKKLARSNTRSK